MDSYTKFLFEQYNLLPLLENRGEGSPQVLKNQLVDIFSQLSNIFKLSLREQEQCFTQLALVIATTAKTKLYLPYLAALLLLKAKDGQLYKRLVEGKASVKEITDFICLQPGGKGFLLDKYGTALEIF